MAQTVCLHSREEIAAYLRRDPARRLYELGDLDDFFWPHTTWYALRDHDHIAGLVLVYSGTALPVLLAMGQPEERASLAELLTALRGLLPRRFYAHLSPELAETLTPDYRLESHGRHLKMVLEDRARLARPDTAAVVRLDEDDLPALESLYRAAYPDNWFDPRMLQTRHYFGLRRGPDLVSVAGVHVYSPAYRVAALGNITTHPGHRGQGLAGAVAARLCQVLLQTVDVVGLNVKADNAGAIACYRRLGFVEVAEYEEFMVLGS